MSAADGRSARAKEATSGGAPPVGRLPSFAPRSRDVHAVIDTPAGSRHKYEWADELGAFRLSAVLPTGIVFPYDFGFVPSTLAEDGDALDVLVLGDEPLALGCVVRARLLGVVHAEQTADRERGRPTSRNDRLLAVLHEAPTWRGARALDDLPARVVDEIERFFSVYNALRGRRFVVLGRGGPAAALRAVEEARRTFEARSDGSERPSGGARKHVGRSIQR